MNSEKHCIPPRETQFIRFVDTARKIANEKAIGELDEMLVNLVPLVRAGVAGSRQEEGNLFDQS